MTAISNVNTNIPVTNLDKNVKVVVGKSIETKSKNNSSLSLNDTLNIGMKTNTRFPMQVSTAEMVLQSVVSPILGAVATSPLRSFQKGGFLGSNSLGLSIGVVAAGSAFVSSTTVSMMGTQDVVNVKKARNISAIAGGIVGGAIFAATAKNPIIGAVSGAVGGYIGAHYSGEKMNMFRNDQIVTNERREKINEERINREKEKNNNINQP